MRLDADPSPQPAGGSADLAVPAPADGVALLGELPGSGYRDAPCLVRRADGQTLQLTPLLYRVLEAVDGRRDLAEIAEHVTEQVGRRLTADAVDQLVREKLLPLGVLCLPDGRQPDVVKSDPLLGLRFRWAVTDPDVTRRLTTPFAVLFRPLVVSVVVAAFLLVTGWVLAAKGLASATAQAFDSPGLLLLVLLFTVLSAGFHEFGHAAACRYGGATPGAMGAGLYLVWPAFYTDVDDSYRLDRAGRLRVDLGGLYFNALFAVAVFGVWAVVRFDALLLLLVAQVLQMVRQLTPLVRFDGYHVLADLTGVPDLFSRIGPTLRGLLPWNWGKPETRVLRPWARFVVTAWVLVTVPLLLGCLALMVLALPRVVATAWASLGRRSDDLGRAFGQGDVAAAVVDLLAMVALALPLLGTAFVLVSLTRRLAGWAWRRTDGSTAGRAFLVAATAALVAFLAWAWWPDDSRYRPVTAADRGTLADVLPRAVPAHLDTQALAPTRAASTVWVWDGELPTADRPELALVLTPTGPGADEAPTWVFPFDRPAPPGAEGNQAFALNTEDGSVLYKASFSLVWADGTSTAPRNEAYALADCTDCSTVAVAFQVVLVVGETSLALPENVAAAVNVSCTRCLTTAIAQQLVLSVPGGLSEQGRAEVERTWARVAALQEQLGDLTLDELRAQLEQLERDIEQVVQADLARTGATATPSATSTATASPSVSPSASPSSTPTPTFSAEEGSSDATSSPTPEPTSTSTSEPTAEPEVSGTGSEATPAEATPSP